MKEDIKFLKEKVEKLDKTVRVLINALSKAGVIEFVDSSKKHKKTLKVNQAEELANEA
jgi:predicted transcriptional regulator